jgi:hypothetical protein
MTTTATCVAGAPPGRVRISGLCNIAVNRVYTLIGTLHGHGHYRSANGFNLYPRLQS